MNLCKPIKSTEIIKGYNQDGINASFYAMKEDCAQMQKLKIILPMKNCNL